MKNTLPVCIAAVIISLSLILAACTADQAPAEESHTPDQSTEESFVEATVTVPSQTEETQKETIPNETSAPAATERSADGNIAVNIAYAGNNTNYSSLFEDCLNVSQMVISSVQHLPVFVIDTKEELVQFRTRYQNDFSIDRGYAGIPSFAEATSGFDEAFFEKNSLILAYITTSNAQCRFAVREMELTDSALCLNVVEINHPEAYADDRACWFVITEVPDELIAGCTQFDAKIGE